MTVSGRSPNPSCRLVSNLCQFLLSPSAKTKCDECGSQQVTVLYKNGTTRFKDGAEEKTGCVFCSADFIPLVEKHRAISSRPAQPTTRGRGGRGGAVVTATGRGGGGGGGPIGTRGNRRGAPKDKMDQLAAYFV